MFMTSTELENKEKIQRPKTIRNLKYFSVETF